MKNMKKIVALLVAALILVASMSALAAPADVSLTVDAVEGHTYTYFQLLVGDLSTDKTTLSNVRWGSDVADSITYNETTIEPVAGEDVPEAFLTYLSGLTSNSQETANTIAAMVKGDGETIPADGATVKTGYYVVKDAYTNPSDKQTTTLSTTIVNIVGPTEITPKAGTTTHTKEVWDTNDSEAELNLDDLTDLDSGWDKSADHDFGDDVPFRLTTTIASDFAKYDTYKLYVHDTLSSGLQLNKDSFVVTVNGVKIEAEGNYTIEYPTSGETFIVKFDKLNDVAGAAAGKDVVVYYTAKLLDTAVIGNPGNPNTSYAEYSNNPNGDQDGTTKTPEDKAVVFTLETVVNKVDGEEKPLKGAGFTLYKQNADGDYVPVGDEIVGGDTVKFEFKGLDDGEYKIVETTTPNGYNTIEPIEFTLSADHEVTGITKINDADAEAEVDFGSFKATVIDEYKGIESDVVNKSGSTLPSTGGIGTTIFYVAGSILVLAAAILLITKRRMGAED